MGNKQSKEFIHKKIKNLLDSKKHTVNQILCELEKLEDLNDLDLYLKAKIFKDILLTSNPNIKIKYFKSFDSKISNYNVLYHYNGSLVDEDLSKNKTPYNDDLFLSYAFLMLEKDKNDYNLDDWILNIIDKYIIKKVLLKTSKEDFEKANKSYKKYFFTNFLFSYSQNFLKEANKDFFINLTIKFLEKGFELSKFKCGVMENQKFYDEVKITKDKKDFNLLFKETKAKKKISM